MLLSAQSWYCHLWTCSPVECSEQVFLKGLHSIFGCPCPDLSETCYWSFTWWVTWNMSLGCLFSGARCVYEIPMQSVLNVHNNSVCGKDFAGSDVNLIRLKLWWNFSLRWHLMCFSHVTLVWRSVRDSTLLSRTRRFMELSLKSPAHKTLNTKGFISK